MNRADFQWLADERIRDAKAMLAAARWSGAYYVAGYAVECALKSCIIARLMASDEFPERKFSEQCWTHGLPQLLKLAGLKAEFDAASAADANLLNNWFVVTNWDESSRYARKSKAEAEELFFAIIDKKHGVLPWLKSRW